jgi:hypothetical protein
MLRQGKLRLGGGGVNALNESTILYGKAQNITDINYENITINPLNFKYPLSTDGHIFNTTFIKDLLIEIDFRNPNTLEAFLQRFVVTDSIPKTVKSFTESKLVSIPANLVNDTFNNRHGLQFGISEKELNDKFLSGNEIDLISMEFLDINGPHKELKYVFK